MKKISINSTKLVETAVDVLKEGGLVIFPCETCYGAGVDATNPTAVKRLLRYKDRREGNPISIAVTNKNMASKYAEINETAENIYDNYLPGPITVVSKSTGAVAKGLESEYGTIGIRIPDYTKLLDIIKKYGKPVTSTSANVAYRPNPYSVEQLLKNLPEKNKKLIDLIIDAGELPIRETSTVVDTTLNSMNILREGRMMFDIPGDQLLKAETKTVEETINFGSLIVMKIFTDLIDNCVILSLGGDLGTGKTHLTKGIGRQLGIKQLIKSPTFNLVSEYPYDLGRAKGSLIHIDTWRIKDVKELSYLKIDDYLKKGNLIVIEWADKFFGSLEDLSRRDDTKCYKIKFKYLGENDREIILESC
ncbi:MAG: L-threonylcarbamoyladenylate synthase [bacterium]